MSFNIRTYALAYSSSLENIYYLFPEIIFFLNSVKSLVKKISELDYKVSILGLSRLR